MVQCRTMLRRLPLSPPLTILNQDRSISRQRVADQRPSSSLQTLFSLQLKMKWRSVLLATAGFLLTSLLLVHGEVWEEDEKEVLIRSERGANNSKEPCRYEKGPWSECDTKTNTRSRTLTLKKKTGDQAAPTCEPTKTIQKKCKKACRYEKGTWSACNAQNEMVRTDTVKEKSDPSCEQKRLSTKKCKTKTQRENKTNRTTKPNKQGGGGGGGGGRRGGGRQ